MPEYAGIVSGASLYTTAWKPHSHLSPSLHHPFTFVRAVKRSCPHSFEGADSCSWSFAFTTRTAPNNLLTFRPRFWLILDGEYVHHAVGRHQAVLISLVELKLQTEPNYHDHTSVPGWRPQPSRHTFLVSTYFNVESKLVFPKRVPQKDSIRHGVPGGKSEADETVANIKMFYLADRGF